MAAVVAWLTGAPLRIGFAGPISREFNHLVQNHLVRLPGKGVHRIERNLALLAPLGIATRYAPPLLPSAPPPRPGQAGAQIDEALPPKLTGGPLVLIHPGTSRFASLKRWIPSRYARVGDSLVQSHGADVLVSYGPDDRALAEEIVSLMKNVHTKAITLSDFVTFPEIYRQLNEKHLMLMLNKASQDY